MWKTVLAGSTALAIAGATLAYAQQGPGGRDFAPRWRPSAQDITAFGDARIAALHAGLEAHRRAGEELAGGGKRAARSRQATLGAVRRARQRRSSEGSGRTAGLARRRDDATRRRAQETRRRGRPALQEPGRRAEAPLRRAGAARRAPSRRRARRARFGHRWMHRGQGGERGPMGPNGDRPRQ